MKHILVLTDFSASAESAAECGRYLAGGLHQDMLLVNVYSEMPSVLAGSKADRRESTIRLNGEIRRLEKGLPTAGIRYKPAIHPVPLEGDFSESVLALARRKNVSLIVTGMSCRSYSGLLSTGHIKILLETSLCPVLSIPEKWTAPEIRHIMLASDLQSEDLQFTGDLLGFFEKLGTKISVIHVSNPVLIPDFAGEKRTAAFAARLADRYPAVRFYSARNNCVREGLDAESGEKKADVIALHYQKRHLFYRLCHGNPLKQAIKAGKSPIFVFPDRYISHVLQA